MSLGPQYLRCRVVRDAVLAARPDLDDWSGPAGVVRRAADGSRVVEGCGLRRFGREQIPRLPDPDAVVPSWRLPQAVFAGYLYDHYGHFLTDSLARTWLPRAAADAPVVWIAAWTETIAPFMHEVLDIVDVDARRHVVTATSGPLAVDELLVPDPAFEFGSFMHPWLGRRLGRAPAAEHPSRHVWLSRSRLVPISGLDEERERESRVAAEGWEVVHPEDLSVGEQVSLLGEAVHVAGIEGSAFHTLVLLDGCRARIDLFTRQDHLNFELVAAASGLDQHRHPFPGATPRERAKTRGTDVQWSGVDIDATVALLNSGCTDHGHEPPRTDR